MGDVGWVEDALAGAPLSNEFVGYSATSAEAEILAIIGGSELVEKVSTGEEASIVLSKTPFYAESGGQVGDTGIITAENAVFEVTDCRKSANGLYIHSGVVKSGTFSTNQAVKAQIDTERRNAITRNHTAAHLLQAALREVLGDHVHQAGQLVDDHICRFDFSHFSAMTEEEIAKVEHLVNQKILEGIDVKVNEMPIDEAKKIGAMALFGEKYGDVVRVCKVKEFSTELCGGCHATNTAKLGLFKILKESSVAAGVRRIEAVTGLGVLSIIEEQNKIMAEAANNLKAGSASELPAKTAAISAELKAKEKEIDALNQKIADSKLSAVFENAMQIGSVRFIAAGFAGTKPDALRKISDTAKANNPDIVALFFSVLDGKATINIVCGADAVKAGVHAGKLVKEITAALGGSGGGKPDSAMGGCTDTLNIDAEIAKLPEKIKAMLK